MKGARVMCRLFSRLPEPLKVLVAGPIAWTAFAVLVELREF